MRSLLLLICSMVVGSILGGCSPQNELVRDASTPNSNKGTESEPKLVAPDRNKMEAFVIRAKYYQTTGPCIELGDDLLGMPIIDAFEVVEVLNGDLKVESRPVQKLIRRETGAIVTVYRLQTFAISSDVGRGR